MKEIRILIQQLRGYPNNFFVYPVTENVDVLGDGNLEEGLLVCDKDGDQQGYIETGGQGEVVVK